MILLITDFAQNRSTIELSALFCTANVTIASFYSQSLGDIRPTTGHTGYQNDRSREDAYPDLRWAAVNHLAGLYDCRSPWVGHRFAEALRAIERRV